jgi:tetratricopeptide (TPR) repeat protein
LIRTLFALVAAAAVLSVSWVPVHTNGPTLADAQRAFFNARYQTAAELALAIQTSDVDGLASYEVRTSALHFQLRDALGSSTDKAKAFKQCATCPALLKAFLDTTAKGQALARARLAIDPADDDALFFLGKLNLNYVWLHLETLGRKTGWSEYWEARRSLDAALKDNPRNMRARVARAWVDYIVDTKMARGTRWVLGGGSKKRAFIGARAAAADDSEFFVRVEAEFALWEMLVRDRQLAEATTIAQRLARDFPENHKLANFLKTAPALNP